MANETILDSLPFEGETAPVEVPAESATPLDSISLDPQENLVNGMKGSLFYANQTTPERAAEAVQIAKNYSIDPSFVHENLDEFKKSDTFDYESLASDYPGVSTFFQKPENAAIAHDDLDSLKKIERGSGFFSSVKDETLGDVAGGFNTTQKALITTAGLFGLLDHDTANFHLESLERDKALIDSHKPDYRAAFEKEYAESGNDLGKSLARFTNIYGDLKRGEVLGALKDYYGGAIGSVGSILDLGATVAKNPQAAAHQAVEGLVPFSTMVAAGLSAGVGVPAAAVAGLTALAGVPIFVGQKFEELAATKKKTASEAFKDPNLTSELRGIAIRYGVSMSAIAALVPGLAGTVGKGTAAVSTLGSRVASSAANVGLQAGAFGAGHSVSNVIAGQEPDIKGAIMMSISMLAPAAVFEGLHAIKPREQVSIPDYDVMPPESAKAPGEGKVYDVEAEPKQLTSSTRENYSADPVQAVSEVAHDTTEAVNTLHELQALDEIGDTVKESKMAERVPEKVSELMQASGAEGHVFFQSSDWDQFWTKQGLSPVTAAEQIMGDQGKAYMQAKETGGLFKIPMAEYVAKVAPTEHYKALLGILKTRENGMSFNDANEHLQAVPETVKAIAKDSTQVVDEAKEIASRTEQELLAAGRPAEEAKASSKLVESRLKARSEITGISPKAYFEKYGFEVSGDTGETLAEVPKEVLNQSDHSDLEKGFRQKLKTPEAAAEYEAHPEAMGGKYLNQDIARDLLPEYKASPEGARQNLELTQKPTGHFTQKLFDRALKKPVLGDASFIIGGPGAGKTVAGQTKLHEMNRISDVVLDTVGANEVQLSKNIDSALKSGRPVNVVFVFTPFEKSLENIIERYKKTGRDVPPEVAASGHVKSLETYLKLKEKYQGDDRVGIHAITPDFETPGGFPVDRSLSEIQETRYIGPNETEQSATERLQKIAEERLAGVREEVLAAREARRSVQENAGGSQSGSSSTSLTDKKLFQSASENAPAFYSKLQKIIEEKMPKTATVDQVRALARETKAEEIQYSGLEEFLKGKSKVSKDDLLNFLRENQIEIKEVVRGGADHDNLEIRYDDDNEVYSVVDGTTGKLQEVFETEREAADYIEGDTPNEVTKFSKYTLPGGENYREVLLTLPKKPIIKDLKKNLQIEPNKDVDGEWDVVNDNGRVLFTGRSETDAIEYVQETDYLSKNDLKTDQESYHSSHFDEPNILAHMRLDDRIDAEGKRVLFVEEIQSDWHQEGRKKGYQNDGNLPTGYEIKEQKSAPTELRFIIQDEQGRVRASGRTEELAKNEFARTSGGVPDAPFKKTWQELALKRIIREAAEKGYDKIAWTTGEQQAERYPRGEDEASKIAQLNGMKGFYDKILVDAANKLAKKFGGKVEETEFPAPAHTEEDSYGNEVDTEEGGFQAHSLELTPALRDSVMKEGFSLFQGPNDQGPRGQIEFGPYKALIKLGEKADASTFIHESFHLWTKEFIDDYKHLQTQPELNDKQAQFMADGETLLNYVGAKSFDELTTEQWEKIAESGEEYLREGKAPTRELQGVFTRFKTWITYLYKSFRNNSIKLSSEIRGVFDRMIAAEETAEAHAFDPLFKNEATDGMTELQATEYRSLQGELKKFSEDQLRSSLMTDLKKQQSKDYSMAKDMIRNRIIAEVNASPAYQALAMLKDGLQADGSELPAGTFPIKLSREAIIEKYGPDYIGGLPKGIFDKEMGLPPDMAAEMLGFKSGDDLLHTIANLPQKQEAIETLTEAGIKKVYPDLLDEPQLSDEAVKAANNDLKSQVLRMELEHLASENLPALKGVIRNITRRPPTNAEVKAKALGMIDKLPITELSEYSFELAERKASKEAGELLAKGDIEGAYQAKNRELLNHELYKAAVRANEDIEKAVQNFKKVAKSDETLAKGRDTDLVNAARALLAQYGLGRTKKSPAEYLRKAFQYDQERATLMLDLVGPLSEFPKDYRELSYEEFSVLKNTFDALWSLSKEEKEIAIEGRRVAVEEAVEALHSSALTFQSAKPTAEVKATKGEFDKLKLDLKTVAASGRTVESLIDQMDGGDIYGAFRKYIFTTPNEAAEAYRVAKVDVFTKLEKIMSEVSQTFKSGKIDAPELGYTFGDKSNLFMALMHTGSPSNLSKLLRGRGWGELDLEGNLDTSRWESFLTRMIKEGQVTKSDYDYAQQAWDLFRELLPETQAAFKKINGYYFNEIAERPFTAFDTQYQGGYVPARMDYYESKIARDKKAIERFEEKEKVFAMPTTGSGFTKSRVESFAAPLDLGWEMLKSGLDLQLRYIHIEPAVKQTARLLKNPVIAADIAAYHPDAMDAIFAPWLHRLAKQSVSEPGTYPVVDQMARFFKASATMQYLAFDVANAMQQLTGVITAGVKVHPQYLLKGAHLFLQPGTLEMIFEKSSFMKSAHGTDLSHIEESIYDLTSSTDIVQKSRKVVQGAAKKYGTFLSRTFQHVVNVITWVGAYNEAIEKSPKSVSPLEAEKMAVRTADRAVRLTQGSSLPEHVSRWAQGTPATSIFKMFQNFPNMMMNLQVSEQTQSYQGRRYKPGQSPGAPEGGATGNPIHPEQGLKLRNLSVGFFGFIVVMALSKHITTLMSGNADKNKDGSIVDDLARDSVLGPALGLTSWVPIAGPAAASGIYAAMDKNPAFNVKVPTSPIVSLLERGTKGAGAVLTKKHPTGSDFEDFMSLLGFFTGTPLGTASRPAGYLYDLNKRNIKQPTGPIDFGRGLVTGRGAKKNK